LLNIDIEDIDIFWYSHETINNNSEDRILQKLVFVSYYKVKDLIKDNLYDNLVLHLA
jgi:hypothetical protein